MAYELRQTIQRGWVEDFYGSPPHPACGPPSPAGEGLGLQTGGIRSTNSSFSVDFRRQIVTSNTENHRQQPAARKLTGQSVKMNAHSDGEAPCPLLLGEGGPVEGPGVEGTLWITAWVGFAVETNLWQSFRLGASGGELIVPPRSSARMRRKERRCRKAVELRSDCHRQSLDEIRCATHRPLLKNPLPASKPT